MRTTLASVVALFAPRITAQAACGPSFIETRCVCCGCSRKTSCKQQRSCNVCTEGKICSAWVTVGGCGPACC